MGLLIPIIILAVFVVLFVRQTRQAAAGSNKRRAYTFATVVAGLFLLLNVMTLLGLNMQSILLPMQLLGVVLLAISVFFLVRAWRSGEMREQVDKMREIIQEERERREQERQK